MLKTYAYCPINIMLDTNLLMINPHGNKKKLCSIGQNLIMSFPIKLYFATWFLFLRLRFFVFRNILVMSRSIAPGPITWSFTRNYCLTFKIILI